MLDYDGAGEGQRMMGSMRWLRSVCMMDDALYGSMTVIENKIDNNIFFEIDT